MEVVLRPIHGKKDNYISVLFIIRTCCCYLICRFELFWLWGHNLLFYKKNKNSHWFHGDFKGHRVTFRCLRWQGDVGLPGEPGEPGFQGDKVFQLTDFLLIYTVYVYMYVHAFVFFVHSDTPNRVFFIWITMCWFSRVFKAHQVYQEFEESRDNRLIRGLTFNCVLPCLFI